MTRTLAAILALVCTVGTFVVLFGHIRHIDELTVNHLYIALSLCVAMGTGILAQHSPDNFMRWSFRLIFLVATIICVGFSGGRSASVFEHNIVAASQGNRTFDSLLASAKRDREEAKAAHSNAVSAANAQRSRATLECSGGKGTRCAGATLAAKELDDKATQLHDTYTEADKRYWDIARSRKAPAVGNSELQHIARLIAKFTFADEKEAMERIVLVLPYLLAIMIEYSAIMCTHYACTSRPLRPLPSPSPPLHSHTHAPVTSGQLARELSIDPKQLRKHLRQLNVARPPTGWAWSRDEADQIKHRISLQTPAGSA